MSKSHSVEPSSNIGQQNPDNEAMGKPKRAVVQTQIEPESLRLAADQEPLQNLPQTGATAATLIDSPDFSQHDIITGLVPCTYALSPAVPTRMQVHHKTWRGSWALSSIQLLYACRKGIIPGPPKLSTADLEDRSKGDVFVKGAAILQLTWLMVQMIAGASEGLAISLLEVTTLALAVCTIATYALLWHKPQYVMTPTYINATNVLTGEQIIGLAARSPVSTLFVKEFWLHGVAIRAMVENILPWSRGIPIRFPRQKDTLYLNPVFIGIGFGGALFGAVHSIAWNFEFATPVERILWRISCCVTICFPLLGTAVSFITIHNARKDSESDSKTNALLRLFTTTCILMYLLARSVLMTEVFRSLAYAPPSTFKEIDWPSALPRVN